jgi:hypothetical protein
MRKIPHYLILLIFPLTSGYIYSNQLYSPSYFNLVQRNGVVEFLPSKPDSMCIGLFTPEDFLLDVAVAHKGKKEITIYRNFGNGYFGMYKSIPVSKDVRKLGIAKVDDHYAWVQQHSDLLISYSDGSEEIIRNPVLNRIGNDKTPYRDFMYEPKAFIYNLDFMEVWRSERNGQPHHIVTVGDLDNDGKTELVYTFYPLTDSFPILRPTRIVVFEAIGNNNYRIDWDTLLTEGGFNAFHDVFDLDRDGNKEIIVAAYSGVFNGLAYHIMECTGEGKYKFYLSDANHLGGFMDVAIKDTMYFNDTLRNAGMWVCFSNTQIPNYNTNIRAYMFRQKNQFCYCLYHSHITTRLAGFVYSFDVSDIDRDGKDEVLLGNIQLGTGNAIDFLDSTGIKQNSGYEMKTLIPHAPLSAGWFAMKDYDGDGTKEITVCGIGYGTGSVGVIKHTGMPGENSFTTMWWDSTGIFGQPNRGFDTIFIKNNTYLLYPTVRSSGPMSWEQLHLYSYSSGYSYEKIFFKEIDSSFFGRPVLYDIYNNNKIHIISFAAFGYPSNYKMYLMDYEQMGNLNINDPSQNFIPDDYILHQNYPNPFNPETNITFEIKNSSFVALKIYDITGREISVLLNEKRSSGRYTIKFTNNNLSSGVYFYSLFLNDERKDTKRMLMVK